MRGFQHSPDHYNNVSLTDFDGPNPPRNRCVFCKSVEKEEEEYNKPN